MDLKAQNYVAYDPQIISQPTQTNSPSQRRDTSKGDLFPTPKWRDLWAAILFYVQFFIFIALSAWTIHSAAPSLGEDTDKDFDSIPRLNINALVVSLVAPTLISLCILGLSIVSMRSSPEGLIHGSFLTLLVLSTISLIFWIISVNIAGIVCSAIILICDLIFYILARHRIPFSAVILKATVDCLYVYPKMMLISSISFVVFMLYSVYSMISLISVVMIRNPSHPNHISSADALLLFYIFSIIYTYQVIANVTQTTICGVYGTYYFIYGTSQTVLHPVFGSFKRAMTYSFGSICFGSLIVSLITFIRFLLKSLSDERSIIGSIVDCILSIIEDLVRYFNYYAYTQIALYGKPYISAAKDTWELIKSHGVDAVVNDQLIGTTTFIIELSSAFISSIFTFVVFKYGFDNLSIKTYVFYSAFAFFISFVITGLVLRIIEAGSTTLLVCIAEDPQALRVSKPELYNAIAAKYPSVVL